MDLTPDEERRLRALILPEDARQPGPLKMGTAPVDPEIETLKQAKARWDGGVRHNALEEIQPGTFTALGAMAGPYGAAAGAAADIATAVYAGNRKEKRANRIEKEQAQIAGWNQMSKAAANRTALEQRALAQLMRIG